MNDIPSKVYIRKFNKVGETSNSLVIPKKILDKLGINKDDIMKIYIENEKIVIEKIKE